MQGASTWGGNNDVRVCSQLSKLSLHGVSPNQNSSAKVRVAAELFDHLVRLQGKLPSGGQQYSPGAPPQ